jgi:hypothetical protein
LLFWTGVDCESVLDPNGLRRFARAKLPSERQRPEIQLAVSPLIKQPKLASYISPPAGLTRGSAFFYDAFSLNNVDGRVEPGQGD